MEQGASVQVTAHDLAGGLDPKRIRGQAARKIDQGERAVVQQKTMAGPPGIYVTAHDLAPSVDPVGWCMRCARDVNGREGEREGRRCANQESEERREPGGEAKEYFLEEFLFS